MFKDGRDLIAENKRFWISILWAEDCLFTRRLGVKGKIIFGYSVRVRMFGKDIV